MPRQGVGAEHPLNDRAQIVFLLVFFIVWVVDSFVLRYGLSLTGLTALFATVPLGAALFVIGVYFVRKSEEVVFSQKEAKVIDTGVYGQVRHPMYLGGILVLLGLTVSTLSILSFAVWIAFFIFMDRMAAFEEKDLTNKLGQQYVDYRKKVHKWIPTKPQHA